MNTSSSVAMSESLATMPTSKTRQLYAWFVLGFCALFLFYKYVLQVSPSVMAHEWMQQFHLSGAALGNLAAMFFYSYLVTQLLVGPLLDRYSPRCLTALALGVCALGALVLAHADSFATAALARGLMGVGAAFATVNYLKMTTLWFSPKQYALVGGLLATASMLGSMAGQVPLAHAVTSQGWQTALQDCAYLGFLLAVLYYVCVRDRQLTTHHGVSGKSIQWRDYWQLLTRSHNWQLLFYSGLAFSPMAVFGGLWGDPFLEQAYHLTKTQAASLVSMAFIGLAVGAPFFGFLADRRKRYFRYMVFGLSLSLIGLLAGVYSPSDTSYYVLATALFLFGVGTGAFMLGFTLGKSLNPIGLAATVVGLINTGDAVFGAVTEPFVGKLLDQFAHVFPALHTSVFSVVNYHVALVVLPLYLLVAMVLLWRLYRNPVFTVFSNR